MESLHVLSYNVVQKQRDKRSEDYERESSNRETEKTKRHKKTSIDGMFDMNGRLLTYLLSFKSSYIQFVIPFILGNP